MVFEYVASDAQVEMFVSAPFGHMPPNMYKEASWIEVDCENVKPAERYLALSEVSAEFKDKVVQVPLLSVSFLVNLHSCTSSLDSLQLPASTLIPSASFTVIKGLDTLSDKNGSLSNNFFAEDVALRVMEVSIIDREYCEEEGSGEIR